MQLKPRYMRINPRTNNGKKYMLLDDYDYYSITYGRWVRLKTGFLSDGATGARDLPDSWSWLVHDKLCDDAAWDDGSPCSAWQASQVLSDILDSEGYGMRRWTWKWATFLFGSINIKRRVGWRLKRKPATS